MVVDGLIGSAPLVLGYGSELKFLCWFSMYLELAMFVEALSEIFRQIIVVVSFFLGRWVRYVDFFRCWVGLRLGHLRLQ